MSTLQVEIQVAKEFTLEQLNISQAREDSSFTSFLGDFFDCTIHLNLMPQALKRGGFKQAALGHSSQPIFGGTNKEICAKQAFNVEGEGATSHV